MPEELNDRVDNLVAEVRGLRDGVRSVRDELAEANDRAESAEVTAKRSRSWVKVLGLSLAVSIIVSGVLFAALFAFAMRNRTGQCVAWRNTAGQNVTTQTTDFGRSLIRTAADAYRLTGCEGMLGPLPAVDPDAYRPAPAKP